MGPELRNRCLDFARRYITVGLSHYTPSRRELLWHEAESFLQYCIGEGCTGWETGPDYHTMPCDLFEDSAYRESDAKWRKDKTNRFFDDLRFVCRLAFDIIDGMPGGTLGLTVGTVRRMFEGTIPQWFLQPWLDETEDHTDLNTMDDTQVLLV